MLGWFPISYCHSSLTIHCSYCGILQANHQKNRQVFRYKSSPVIY